MAKIEVLLFGPPQLRWDEQQVEIGHRKSTALLTYLATTNQPHSRDSLASLLWPNDAASHSHANLRRALYRLNHLLDTPLLAAHTHTIAIDPSAGLWVDVHAFQAAADRALSETDGTCIPALEAALELYNGDFLAGFGLPDCPAFDDWHFFQAESLRRQYAAILNRLVGCLEQGRQWEKAIQYQRRLLALDPLNESAYRRLMRLYAYSDQPAAALRKYEELLRRLAQDMRLEPEAETTDLYQAIKARRLPAQPEEQPAGELTPQLFAPPHTLPTNTIPFAGRGRELEQLTGLLADPAGPRLLTITGPGGIGKTRLSVEAVLGLLPRFPDGVFFIPMGSASTLDQLLHGVCEGIGHRFYSGVDLKFQLLNYLRERDLLLLIDNFDALTGEAAFIAELLESAPRVRVLITSRQRLNLSGELVFPLAGLPFGAADGSSAWDSEAVQLLVRLAKYARHDMHIGEEDLPAIQRICELVGGMPLALVLAAGWLELLSFQEVADEIACSIDFLQGRLQDLPERHQSIRAAFEYSWGRLSRKEQQVLMRASVFTGGFDRHAALAVAGADLPALRTLIDKSLIAVSGVSRYDIHPVICSFAAEKLEEAGATAEIFARHSRYYLEVLGRLEAGMKSEGQLEALQEIETDLGNMRSAWMYAAHHLDGSDAGQAVESLYLFFTTRSRYQEGLELFQGAYAALSSRAEIEADAARRILARAYWFQALLLPGEPGTKKGLLRLISEQRRDRRRCEAAFCLLALGVFDLYAWRDPEKAVARLEQSLHLYQKLDDRFYTAVVLLWLGTAHGEATHLTNMVSYTRQSLELSRQTGSVLLIPYNLRNLAFASLCSGSYADADAYNQEALAVDSRIGFQMGIANALTYAGLLNLLRGNLERACSQAQKGLQLAKEVNFTTLIVEAQAVLSLAATLTGSPERGQRLAEALLDMPGSHFGAILARWAAALALCFLGEYERADGHLQEGLKRAEQLGYPAVVVWLLPAAAVIEHQRGHCEQAARLYQRGVNSPLALQGWMAHWDDLIRLSIELEERLPSARRDAGGAQPPRERIPETMP